MCLKVFMCYKVFDKSHGTKKEDPFISIKTHLRLKQLFSDISSKQYVLSSYS